MAVPDQPADRLLRLPAPVGLRAVYLTNGSFVLELLAFAGHPPTPRPDRTMSDVGLTHLSIGVDDLEAAKDAVAAAGGAVLDDTDVGVAVMVRDPDGQFLELLDVRTAPSPRPDRHPGFRARRPPKAPTWRMPARVSSRASRSVRTKPVSRERDRPFHDGHHGHRSQSGVVDGHGVVLFYRSTRRSMKRRSTWPARRARPSSAEFASFQAWMIGR